MKEEGRRKGSRNSKERIFFDAEGTSIHSLYLIHSFIQLTLSSICCKRQDRDQETTRKQARERKREREKECLNRIYLIHDRDMSEPFLVVIEEAWYSIRSETL